MTNGQKRRGRIAPYLAMLLPLVALALAPMNAGAVTLGTALTFSALSTSDDVTLDNVAKVGTNNLGSLGGNDVTMGNNSFAGGDLIADPGAIKIGNYSKVVGTCFWTTGITFGLGVKDCLGGNTGGGDPGSKGAAITDTATFVTALLAAPVTQPIAGPVKVKNFPGTTLTDTVAGGLNIIKISGGDLTLNASSTLTLMGTGTPGETLVLWVDDNLIINSGSKIVLKGGLTPADVVIFVNGTVGPWNNSTTIGATLLAPNSPVIVGSTARVDGAVIGGGLVRFLQNATLLYDPATNVNIPSNIPPPPITLGSAAPYLVLSTSSDTTLGHVNFANTTVPNAGDVGGNTDIIGDFAKVQGDVVAASLIAPAITINQHAKVAGNCITSTSPASTQVSLLGVGPSKGTCGGFSDPSSKYAAIQNTAADVLLFSGEVGALPVDQALASINVTANTTLSACSVPETTPGVFVFSTPWVKIANSKSLTIDGSACAAGDVVVINVTGPAPSAVLPLINLGAGFSVKLSGGLDPAHVVFNVIGASVNPNILNGTNSTFNGALVAPVQICKVGSTNVTFNGQLICGSTVTVGDNVTANYVPLVTIP